MTILEVNYLKLFINIRGKSYINLVFCREGKEDEEEEEA